MFKDLYRFFIYEPQLNLLYWLHKLFGGDIGFGIIGIAFLVNLIILPIFAKNYINMQKMKILQPFLTEIRENYKDKPQEMLLKMQEFNKKHGLNNSYTFLVLFIQLFFVSGLYFIIKDVVENKVDAKLYTWLFGDEVLNFKDSAGGMLAFGKFPVNEIVSVDYIWMPIIIGILSYLYGMYTFRWSPKPKLSLINKPKPKPKDTDKEPLFDPEAFQKNMEFQTIYFMPLFLAGIQFTLPVGLTIYMMTSSLLSLLRQIFLINYYYNHTDKLIDEINKSDPTNFDNIPENDIKIAEVNNETAITEVKIKPIKKKKKKAKNKSQS